MAEVKRRASNQSNLSHAGFSAEGSVRPSSLSKTEPNPALGGGDFRLGLVTYNLAKDWDIPTLIRHCEQTGLEAVELRTTHRHGVEPSLSKEERLGVKNQFSDSGVRLLSLGSTCEFHSPDPAVVKKNIEETKKFIELAHDIGALGVKVRPNGIPQGLPEERTLEQIGKSLRECGSAGLGYGIEVWLEVHGRDTSQPGRIRRIMQAADHPQAGVCWNSNPEDVLNGSVRQSFEMLRPWLRNAHINELWKKEYPWRELFRLMKDAEYNRYCLAEIPESSDPIRLMHYYRALWLELCR